MRLTHDHLIGGAVLLAILAATLGAVAIDAALRDAGGPCCDTSDPVRVAPLAGGGAVVVRDGWVARYGPDGSPGAARVLVPPGRGGPAPDVLAAGEGVIAVGRGTRIHLLDPERLRTLRTIDVQPVGGRGVREIALASGSLWSAAHDARAVVRSAPDGRSRAALRFDDVVVGLRAAEDGGRLLVRTGRPSLRAELREIALPSGRTVATWRGRPGELADRAAAIAADDGTMVGVRGDDAVEVRSAATGRIVARCRAAPLPRRPVGADGTWWFAAGWPDMHLFTMRTDVALPCRTLRDLGPLPAA